MNSILEEKKRRREEEKTQDTREYAQEVENYSPTPPLLHSSTVSVRPYTASDYAAVLRLWEQANLRPFTDVEVERLLRSGGGALVAAWQGNAGSNEARGAEGERVIGIVLWSHNGSIGILWRLAVDESARGQGIATRLLDRAEQDIRAAGLSGVSLLTRVNNTVAKGMYVRRGYRWNDHLEFWGKKLPEPSEVSEVSGAAGSGAVDSESAVSEDVKTAHKAGGQGQC